METTPDARMKPGLKARLIERMHDPLQLRATLCVVLLAVWYTMGYTPMRDQIAATTAKLDRDRKRLALATEVEASGARPPSSPTACPPAPTPTSSSSTSSAASAPARSSSSRSSPRSPRTPALTRSPRSGSSWRGSIRTSMRFSSGSRRTSGCSALTTSKLTPTRESPTP